MTVKNKRILHGFLSIGSSAIVITAVIIAFGLMFSDISDEEIPNELSGLAIAGVCLEAVSVIACITLMALYMYDALRNKRMGWAIALYCLNIFTIPAYWHKYMYKE